MEEGYTNVAREDCCVNNKELLYFNLRLYGVVEHLPVEGGARCRQRLPNSPSPRLGRSRFEAVDIPETVRKDRIEYYPVSPSVSFSWHHDSCNHSISR